MSPQGKPRRGQDQPHDGPADGLVEKKLTTETAACGRDHVRPHESLPGDLTQNQAQHNGRRTRTCQPQKPAQTPIPTLIIARSRPKAPSMRPFSTLPDDRLAISVSPRIASQKYSRAERPAPYWPESGRASSAPAPRRCRPRRWPAWPRVMARSPSPRRAMGRPSKVVAIAEGFRGY